MAYTWEQIKAAYTATGQAKFVEYLLMWNGRKRKWSELSAQEQQMIADLLKMPREPGAPTTYYTPINDGSNTATPQVTTPTAPADPVPAPVDVSQSNWDTNKQFALDQITKTFTEWGMTSLIPKVKQWLIDGMSADSIYLLIRDTPEYQSRFPGMKSLSDQGIAISEGSYIELERAYMQTFKSYGLPKGFYDNPDDFGKFIANQVSPEEVADRVSAAKSFLDSTNPEYMKALRSYYGLTSGDVLAYVLDPEKSQDAIRKAVRNAQVGAAANTYGFDLNLEEAARYAGNPIVGGDPFSQSTAAGDLKMFQGARQLADSDKRLAAIDQQNYTQTDAIDVVLGDENKRLASEKRASRERARFSGQSGAARTSLTRRRSNI